MKMVVGVILRNYKIYDGIKFVPISYGENFCAYFGLNGVGKSSVLEALDTFFNGITNRPWNRNKKFTVSQANSSYIVPIFLIKKTDYLNTRRRSSKKEEGTELLEKISDFFWNTQKFRSSTSEISEFETFRDKLKENFSSEEYYLIAVGIKDAPYPPISFGTFQTNADFLKILGIEKKQSENPIEAAQKNEEAVEAFFKEKKNFLNSIKNMYHYVYIPSDLDIKNYTKLENENMQKLMHKDVRKEIEKAIGQKNIEKINDSLDKFLESISKELKDYTYQKNTNRQGKITMNDLVEKIIQEYFETKVLTKTNLKIPIDDMSSGEKHKALIDICNVFLAENIQHDRKIILAIDEPESSLHISACYEQFEKLKKISSIGNQVIITTHWYGFLPICGDGNAHNIVVSEHEEGKRDIVSYNLDRYREEMRGKTEELKKEFPADIYLKSKSDLAQAIISSMRAKIQYNYILVEGSSDRIYLENYLKYFVDNFNLRIMPLAGCKEVTAIMKLLDATAEEKTVENQGKVLALIDTDTELPMIDWHGKKNFLFKRIFYDKDKKDIVLLPISSNKGGNVTEIEDTLEPDIFVKVLKSFVKDEDEFKFIENINDDALCSYRAIAYTDDQREMIKSFFKKDGNKFKFAKRYVGNALRPEKVSLVRDICEEFEWQLRPSV